MHSTSWSQGLSVSVGGRGVVSHTGSVLTRLLADRVGLTGALSKSLARPGFVPGHDRGRVRITIDGVRVATVDLRSSSPHSRRIVFHQRLRPGRHTIEVRTVGSARTPATGARVDVDGFLVIGP